MKMKKLLAGVLSAAMVATMIPASMAFSGVSAEGPDNLVASFDFTDEGDRADWYEYSGLDYALGDVEQITQSDETGFSFTAEGAYTYSIANPLKGKVTDSFSIVADVAITGTMNEYNGLFGFNNHTAWNAFELTTNGATIRQNAGDFHTGYDNVFYDVVDTTPVAGLGSTMSRLVMVVDASSLTIYVNGSQVKTFNLTADGSATAYSIPASIIANGADYFNFGCNFTYIGLNADSQWNNSNMTVSGVAFYNDALTAPEVSGLGDTNTAMPEKTVDITSDLAAAYTFDNDSLTDTITGATATISNGRVENDVLKLDGEASAEDGTPRINYAQLPVTLADADTQGVTISTWMKADSDSAYLGDIYNVLFGLEQNNDGIVNKWFALRQDGCMGYNALSSDFLDPCLYNNPNVPTGKVVSTDSWNLITVTISDASIKTYVNGELWYRSDRTHNNGAGSNAGFLDAMVGNDYVVLGATLRGFWCDSGFDGSYDNVLVYDRALTSDEVSALATNNADSKVVAEYIADSLDLHVYGFQKTTSGDNAIRFVANQNAEATRQYWDSIVSMGWAFEQKVADADWDTYGNASVTTVTTAHNLVQSDAYFAYTLVISGTDYWCAVPYAQIEVNGNTYFFCYNGGGASYAAEAMDYVLAPTSFTGSNSL